MNAQELFDWVAAQWGILPEYPWGDNENAILRHRENRKWFAAILAVRRDRLGLPENGTVKVLNIKCDPRMIGSLLDQPGFHRAYHMNKEKWISIRLDGSVCTDQLLFLLGLSYDLTGLKPKKKKTE